MHPLIYAAQLGHTRLCEYLVEELGCNINVKGPILPMDDSVCMFESNALAAAVAYKNEEPIKFFLSRNV